MKFNNLHILVLGDIFLDEYQFGECTRISPEAPVPIVQIDHAKTKTMLGGAGNVAANIHSLGGQCTLGARVGLDNAGEEIKLLAQRAGIIPEFTHPRNYRTSKKTRIVAQRQQIVRIDDETIGVNFSAGSSWPLPLLMQADAIVVSDYAKGYFSKFNLRSLIAQAKELGIPVIVDPKPIHKDFYAGADYITPNQHEFDEMVPILDTNVLLTKGAEGMEFFGADGSHIVRPTVAREVFDVAGAGDTVVAAFALAIASKMPLEQAIDFANKAAGVVVAKQGTSTVTIQEIEALEAAIH